MRAVPKPPGKATYVASDSDKEWLRSVQKKLHSRSWDDPDYVFHKLWGLVTDPTIQLEVGAVVHIPSLRVLTDIILGESSRRADG